MDRLYRCAPGRGAVLARPDARRLLILSGICALVYQVLWLRLLALTFGVTSTPPARSSRASWRPRAGQLRCGRMADRVRHPLRLFGWSTVDRGVPRSPRLRRAGVASPLYRRIPASAGVAGGRKRPSGSCCRSRPARPHCPHGATLPMSSSRRSHARSTRGESRRAVCRNTAGAIAGALLAGFYLVPQIGLTRSFLLAACVNALVGVIAVITSRYVRAVPLADIDAPVPEASLIPRVSYVVLAVFAISGFASLALEVIWFRVLIVFLGPTTYAFTLMLASVLAGIAAGSAMVAPVMRLRIDWLQALAVLQMGAAVVAVQSFSSLRRAARVPEWLSSLAAWPGSDFLLPAAVRNDRRDIPTAVFMGLAFR